MSNNKKRRFSDVEQTPIIIDASRSLRTVQPKRYHVSDLQKEALKKQYPLYSSSLAYKSNLLEGSHRESPSDVKAPKSISQNNLLLNFNLITADSLCKYFQQGNIKVPITNETLSWKENIVFGLIGITLVPILNKSQISITNTAIYNPSATKFVDDFGPYISKATAAGITTATKLAYEKFKHKFQKKRVRETYHKELESQLPDDLLELKKTCAELYSKLCSTINISCNDREPGICRKKYINEIHERFQLDISYYRNIPNKIVNHIFKQDIRSPTFEEELNDIISSWMLFVTSIDGVADEAGIILAILVNEEGSTSKLKKFSTALNIQLEELYDNSRDKYDLFITSCFVAILYSPYEKIVKFFQDAIFPRRTMTIPIKTEIVQRQENIWKQIDNALALVDNTIDESIRRRPSFNEILQTSFTQNTIGE